MATGQLNRVLQQLRRTVRGQRATGLADGELLERFARERDEAAFEVLVWRHGPLVLSLCHRLLDNSHDAEDALQATFLTLVKKAGAISKGESLGSWLYKVAYRIALRVRETARRRRESAAPVEDLPAGPVSAEVACDQRRLLLEEAIDELPERYRTPTVLCYMQGKSHKEIAEELGCLPGTVTTRLARAREMLRKHFTHRGVPLSAGLLSAALAQQAVSAPVNPLLVISTVRVATSTAGGQAVGAGVIPARVAALTEGVLKTMFFTVSKSTKTALLGVGVLVAGFLIAGLSAMPHSLPAQQPAAQSRDKAPDKVAPSTDARKANPPAPAKAKADAAEVKGRVLDADGKPFAGASVHLWTGADKSRDDQPVRAITGDDGGFRFTARKADLRHGAKVVVTARGHGPDWVELGLEGKRENLTLQLGKEVPVKGRIRTLENKPVVGAIVEVLSVEKPSGKDLTAWIAAWARDSWPSVTRLDAAALGRGQVVTDKDGRFALRGFGQERAVYVRVRGDDIEWTEFWVLTRPGTGPAPGLKRRGVWAAYLARFDHLVGPTKPVVGTVRDKKTGKPIPGIKVARHYFGEGGRPHLFATTDAQGRYRLVGGPKRDGYNISVGGREGLPFFDAALQNLPDTPGLKPVTADFELEHGLEVSGRLLDAAGKPVRGRVTYAHRPDNPHLKDYPGYGNIRGFRISDWGRTGADGKFTVLTIPGPGVLIVAADEARRFVLLDSMKELFVKYKVNQVVHPLHAVVPISPSADKPASLRQNIVLDQGYTVSGKVVGPDGQALAGVHVAGMGDLELQRVFRPPQSEGLKGAEFTVHGLNPRRPRALIFFHPQKRLARVVLLRGDEKAPLVVRLAPLGTVRGRLVDAAKRPVAGASVSVLFQPRVRQLAALNLPGNVFPGGYGLYQVLQKDAEARRAKTDANGEFRVEGLVPGLPYELYLAAGGRGGHAVYNVIPQTGKVTTIGDLKTGGTTDLGTPEMKLTAEEKGGNE